MNKTIMKYVASALLVVLAVLSLTVFSGFATSPENHKDTIDYLGEKQKTVMELTAGATAASAAITLIPGDAGTPIAEKLADFSSYFLLVLCAILLEKYMVTIMGFAAFKLLIPVGCIALIVSLFWRKGFRELAAKLLIFGFMLAAIIPCSVSVSKMIESTYAESIEESIGNVTGEEDALVEDALEAEASEEAEAEAEKAEEASGMAKVFATWTNAFHSAVETVENAVTTSASDVVEKAEAFMNKYMEALAVMLVTSCLIPILVIVFLVWFCKVVLGVQWSPIAVHNHEKCDLD